MTYIDLIAEALEHDPRGQFMAEDIAHMINDGDANLWTSANSVAVTELGANGLLHIPICAGDMDELTGALLPQIEAWAREHGFTGLSGMGRFGWIRALKNSGFSPDAVYVTKRFSDKSISIGEKCH